MWLWVSFPAWVRTKNRPQGWQGSFWEANLTELYINLPGRMEPMAWLCGWMNRATGQALSSSASQSGPVAIFRNRWSYKLASLPGQSEKTHSRTSKAHCLQFQIRQTWTLPVSWSESATIHGSADEQSHWLGFLSGPSVYQDPSSRSKWTYQLETHNHWNS